MRFSLDTHVLLWWLENPKILSKEALTTIQDGNNTIYVSSAVVWEIIIKKSLGKIQVPEDLADVIKANKFLDLPVTSKHALALEKLPLIHRDPFDRIIIAQAQCEGVTLITRDPDMHKYPVTKITA